MPSRSLPRLPTPLLAGLLSLAAPGCGGSGLYPVEGQLVYPDGKAVTELGGASIEFDPLSGREGARGEVQADGSFRLGTWAPGDGAAVGDYRVVIQPSLGQLDRPSARVIPSRYSNLQTSDLRATVKPERNRLVLTVERAERSR